MKKLFLILIPCVIFGQFSYSGSIHPYNLYRLSDGSEISLPLRLASLELGYTWGNIDLKTNSALEYRWYTREYEFDLREIYLVWYPNFGEVRLGKQIFAWGAADGNNPTDNLSAYDYYYLFLPGTDRKIGSLSAAVNLYFGNWQIEAVVIAEHQGNRLPFDEPDFPIIQSTNFFDPRDFIVEVENPYEFGIRVQTSVLESDFSLSYFKGYDRMFSQVAGNIVSRVPVLPDFGYRSTEVVGCDFVSFVGGFTIRGEVAYFTTSNEYKYNESWQYKYPLNAKYYQYVFQAEYTGPLDINLMGQFIGNSVFKVEGETLVDPFTKEMAPLDADDFKPGMGTPFAMFIDRSALFSAIGSIMDDRLEFMVSGLVDLEETGYMFGFGVDYSPIENWNLEVSLNKFIGDGDSASDNIFSQLEDFSHIMIGLKYSF